MIPPDYLGKAALAKDKATEAVKAKNYDAAWGYYHEQKQHYLQHAAAWDFTKAQT